MCKYLEQSYIFRPPKSAEYEDRLSGVVNDDQALDKLLTKLNIDYDPQEINRIERINHGHGITVIVKKDEFEFETRHLQIRYDYSINQFRKAVL
jgi:hypothetical protein